MCIIPSTDRGSLSVVGFGKSKKACTLSVPRLCLLADNKWPKYLALACPNCNLGVSKLNQLLYVRFPCSGTGDQLFKVSQQSAALSGVSKRQGCDSLKEPWDRRNGKRHSFKNVFPFWQWAASRSKTLYAFHPTKRIYVTCNVRPRPRFLHHKLIYGRPIVGTDYLGPIITSNH